MMSDEVQAVRCRPMRTCGPKYPTKPSQACLCFRGGLLCFNRQMFHNSSAQYTLVSRDQDQQLLVFSELKNSTPFPCLTLPFEDYCISCLNIPIPTHTGRGSPVICNRWHQKILWCYSVVLSSKAKLRLLVFSEGETNKEIKHPLQIPSRGSEAGKIYLFDNRGKGNPYFKKTRHFFVGKNAFSKDCLRPFIFTTAIFENYLNYY